MKNIFAQMNAEQIATKIQTEAKVQWTTMF